MQSAANLMASFLAYNSATMKRGTGLLAAALALAVTASLAAARADDPQPTPAPAPSPPAGAPAAAPPAAGPAATLREVVGTILGRVYDAKKKPIVGWMVELSSRGQDALLRVTGTNDKGEYVFKDLPAGIYDIEIGAGTEGSRKKGKIEVRPPFRNIVDFQIGAGGDPAPKAANPLAAALKKRAPGGAGGGAAAPADAAAGEPARTVPVRGLFLDADKRPVPEVQVTFAALEGKGIYQASSGDDGSFTIAAVPPGPYRVLVTSPGYVSLELKSVEVSPKSGLNLSLSLVDYPLNFKRRPEDQTPREEPCAAPPGGR